MYILNLYSTKTPNFKEQNYNHLILNYHSRFSNDVSTLDNQVKSKLSPNWA